MPRIQSGPRRALAALVLAAAPGLALAAHPLQITLKDAQGNAVTSSSTVPYSPAASCGGCHDLAHITQGYHFQQGRTDGAARLQVADTFLGAMLGGYDASANPTKGTGAWWKLSDGMYGKW